MRLYHGSEFIIEKPEYGKGKAYNDYGRGFYCTEHMELAGEWACSEQKSGFINQYELELEGLKVLNVQDSEYSILHWMAILLKYRNFELSLPIAIEGKKYLLSNYAIPIEEYDVIRGYRADDSYFSFAKAFLNNTLTVEQLGRAMYLGELGEQIVIRSRKAFERISFHSWRAADYAIYYPKRKMRDESARAEFRKQKQTVDWNGTFLADLIRGGKPYEKSGI